MTGEEKIVNGFEDMMCTLHEIRDELKSINKKLDNLCSSK